MTASPQQARKEIFARIAERWAAKAPDVVAGPPEMRYQGAEKPGLPGAENFWARASTQLVTTRQVAHQLRPGPGISEVIYASYGVVFVQVFAPMKKPGDYAKGELLATIAQEAFMAHETASGVWFRNPRINELPNDGTWYRWNVIADFQFNQIRGA